MNTRLKTVVAVCLLALAGPVCAAPPDTPAPLNDRQRIIQFMNRAGFGPSPGDVERISRQGFFFYTYEQLHPETIDDSACDRRLNALPSLRMTPDKLYFNYMGKNDFERRQKAAQPVPRTYKEQGEVLNELVSEKLLRAVYSKRQVQEVMVDFWMNHFNIDWNKNQDRWLVTSFERDVVRPHALGRFRDLLGQVAHSPAMMVYLDNAQSSRVLPANPKNPKSKPSGGLNENYARELMELHTLGVDGGYTQHDVVEVARCLTGWGVGRAEDGWPFVYTPARHDDGPKTVMGMQIPAGGGQRDGDMVLDLLARHPSTAHFLATKMCRYFVSDTPPRRLVDQVAAVYLRTDGDIASMLHTIVESPDFWSPAVYRSKIKSPLYLMASALRASQADVSDTRSVQQEMGKLGMPLYQCEPPTGYKDDTATWVSAGSLLERLNFCLAMAANQIKGVKVDTALLQRKLSDTHEQNPVDGLLTVLLADEVSPSVRADLESIAAATRGPAPSPAVARMVGLILGSPDFQRR